MKFNSVVENKRTSSHRCCVYDTACLWHCVSMTLRVYDTACLITVTVSLHSDILFFTINIYTNVQLNKQQKHKSSPICKFLSIPSMQSQYVFPLAQPQPAYCVRFCAQNVGWKNI
jgi:hypothetical protein